MLGVKTYTREYVDSCRARVESDLDAYRNLVAAARSHPASDKAQLESAIRAFESTLFNNLVLVLDAFFVHRLRTVEGKDGNPLNEVRVICNSLLNNRNVMTADKSIKLSPEKSVLQYQFGETIKLNEAAFILIFQAFFTEIERKFV